MTTFLMVSDKFTYGHDTYSAH